MKESVSKEVVVEDCDIHVFKLLLMHLYTDDLDHMMEMVKKVDESSVSSDAKGDDGNDARSANVSSDAGSQPQVG